VNNVLEALRLADRWVDAWNRRNLGALLALYADDAEFHSPFVTLLASVTAPALRGKAALTAHFEASWSVGPWEKMALEDVRLTESGMTLIVRGGCAPKMEMEFRLDDEGLIAWSRSRRTQDLPTPRSA
jgi:ketosteroid isomerase-like protein